MNISLVDLAAYLDSYLECARFPDDQHGIYLASDRPVQHLGLALEPWPDLSLWLRDQALDALFLHRPWHLPENELPVGIGVLSYHLAFDWTLTFGYNSRLAVALGMNNVCSFAMQSSFSQGMCGDIAPTSLDSLTHQLAQLFGRVPTVRPASSDPLKCIAVAGVLNAQSIREAAALGAQAYITGEWRSSAQAAIRKEAMNVLLVGHSVGECWGLRALSALLRERWPELDVHLAPNCLHADEGNSN